MQQVILIIRDGWGFSENNKGNAIKLANLDYTPKIEKDYPTILLNASGREVGVPDGVQGNSEVGHMTIGAGRIIEEPILKINQAIDDDSFFDNKTLSKALEYCIKKNKKLHLLGLLSDGCIHSSIKHLFALLKSAKEHGLKEVYVHAILDGRDVPERSALKYIKMFKQESTRLGVGKIVSLIGRYYAMDRDMNWDREQKAYDLLINGIGHSFSSPEEAVSMRYVKGDPTDYYIQPCTTSEEKVTIEKNDTVIFFNYRNDRARELTALLTGKMGRKKQFPINFISLVEYKEDFNLKFMSSKDKPADGLGYVLGKNKVKQLRIAETDKFAHVTFFFNGQHDQPNKFEERILIPSKKVSSYAEAPEMSAIEIKEQCIKAIEEQEFEFILVNFANADLVGHSGDLNATIKGLKIVDKCVNEIVEKGLEKNAFMLLTADHGNAEEMLYEDGKQKPSHTNNKVPFTLVSKDKIELKKSGGLKDIAPTVIELLGIDQQKQMTGQSLIK